MVHREIPGISVGIQGFPAADLLPLHRHSFVGPPWLRIQEAQLEFPPLGVVWLDYVPLGAESVGEV